MYRDCEVKQKFIFYKKYRTKKQVRTLTYSIISKKDIYTKSGQRPWPRPLPLRQVYKRSMERNTCIETNTQATEMVVSKKQFFNSYTNRSILQTQRDKTKLHSLKYYFKERKSVIFIIFSPLRTCRFLKMPYLCTVFFMVLDF